MASPLRPSPLPADVAAVHEGWHRRGRFVTLAEGHRLFVAQEGEGSDLLLVHGFPSYPQMEDPAGWAAAVLTRCGTGA